MYSGGIGQVGTLGQEYEPEGIWQGREVVGDGLYMWVRRFWKGCESGQVASEVGVVWQNLGESVTTLERVLDTVFGGNMYHVRSIWYGQLIFTVVGMCIQQITRHAICALEGVQLQSYCLQDSMLFLRAWDLYRVWGHFMSWPWPTSCDDLWPTSTDIWPTSGELRLTSGDLCPTPSDMWTLNYFRWPWNHFWWPLTHFRWPLTHLRWHLTALLVTFEQLLFKKI